MRILFVCTHNRCRSILSEAITNHVAGDRITARSAGSQPSGVVHPESLKALQRIGVTTQGLQSQSMDEFREFAPELVITLCDSAAGESCPVWMGATPRLHWGLEDPSKVDPADADVEAAFDECMRIIQARAEALAEIARLPAEQWQRAVQALTDTETTL